MSRLSRTEVAAAVAASGWRLLLGAVHASVPTRSLREGTRIAAAVVAEAGDLADGHVRIDLRTHRVELSVGDRTTGWVGPDDLALAAALAEAVRRCGAQIAPSTAPTSRPVQSLEIAIDAVDIDAVRPFWATVLAMVDDGRGALVDEAGQLPPLWFQQMDAPRPQRNRIHLDVTVADDEALPRVAAAVAAGGRLVEDSFAPMFWVLADPEGNECCVCSWTGRDEWEAARGPRPPDG